MKHCVWFCAIHGINTSPVLAQIKYGTDVVWHSRYEWRGLSIRDGMVLQPDFFLSGGDQYSLTVGGWTNVELTTPSVGEFGYGRTLLGESNTWAELAAAFDAADIAVGWNWYHYDARRTEHVPAGSFNTHEIYARVQFLNLPIVVPRVDYFHDVDKVEGGFVEASLMVRVPLWTQVKAPVGSIFLTGTTGYNIGQDSIAGIERFRDTGFKYAEFTASTVTGYLPVSVLSTQVAFTFGFHLQFNLDATTKTTFVGTQRPRETWWTIGLQLSGPRCEPTKRICI